MQDKQNALSETTEKEKLLTELLHWKEKLALSPSYCLDNDIRNVFELLQGSIPYFSEQFDFRNIVTLVEFLHFSSIINSTPETIPTINRITQRINEIAQAEKSYTSLVELYKDIAKHIETHYLLVQATKHSPRG